MADIILDANNPIRPQIKALYDHNVDGDDEVEITAVVDFHMNPPQETPTS